MQKRRPTSGGRIINLLMQKLVALSVQPTRFYPEKITGPQRPGKRQEQSRQPRGNFAIAVQEVCNRNRRNPYVVSCNARRASRLHGAARSHWSGWPILFTFSSWGYPPMDAVFGEGRTHVQVCLCVLTWCWMHVELQIYPKKMWQRCVRSLVSWTTF